MIYIILLHVIYQFNKFKNIINIFLFYIIFFTLLFYVIVFIFSDTGNVIFNKGLEKEYKMLSSIKRWTIVFFAVSLLLLIYLEYNSCNWYIESITWLFFVFSTLQMFYFAK